MLAASIISEKQVETAPVSMSRNRIVVGITFVALCVMLPFGMGAAYHKYVGLSGTLSFLRSPAAYLRVQRRGLSSIETSHYTRDNSAVYLSRYAETALLPLRIERTRLSDSYAVPKSGGAITVIGERTIIIDRLGELYSYDLTTLTFDRLKSPVLPKYLAAHSFPRDDQRGVNLDQTGANLELWALDIAFLSDRRELAVFYEQLDRSDETGRAMLAVIPFDATRFAVDGTWRQIFVSESHPAHAYSLLGGRMAYGANGVLYLAVSDHFIPASSQNPDTPLGKILKIDLGTGSWHVFTRGHRNPEGLTFLKSGQLFSTEHGPRGGDELNVIVEGSNYGWPKVTLGTAYEDYDWNGATIVGRHAGYAAPLFAWVPSIGVSQLIELHDFHPRWNGDLLVASLKALSLFRLRLEAGRVLYSEPIWVGQRIRDLAQTGDGTIVLWTDDTQLLLVRVDTDQLIEQRRFPRVVSDTVAGCMVCHHFGPTNPTDFAPTLSNLLNRRLHQTNFAIPQGYEQGRRIGLRRYFTNFSPIPGSSQTVRACPSPGLTRRSSMMLSTR